MVGSLHTAARNTHPAHMHTHRQTHTRGVTVRDIHVHVHVNVYVYTCIAACSSIPTRFQKGAGPGNDCTLTCTIKVMYINAYTMYMDVYNMCKHDCSCDSQFK